MLIATIILNFTGQNNSSGNVHQSDHLLYTGYYSDTKCSLFAVTFEQ